MSPPCVLPSPLGSVHKAKWQRKSGQTSRNISSGIPMLLLGKAWYSWARKQLEQSKSSESQVGREYMMRRSSELGKRLMLRQWEARHPCSCLETARSMTNPDYISNHSLRKKDFQQQVQKCWRSMPNSLLAKSLPVGTKRVQWMQFCLTISQLLSVQWP